MLHCNCPLKKASLEAPELIAMSSQSETLTFKELDKRADQQARILERTGITSGDRIALHLPTSPFLISLLFAIWRIGASPCPLNLRLPAKGIEECLENLAPTLFINTPIIPSFIQKQSKSTPQSLLLFTSGSTGTPKIASLSLKSLLKSAQSFPNIELKEQDRWLLSLPLYHVGGIGILLRTISAKATLSLNGNDPKITHLSSVPTQLFRATPVYPHLKALLIGGAPISSYPSHLPSFLSYGLTEMGSWVTLIKTPPLCNNGYPLGFALDGRKLQINKENEILVQGETLFDGYWKEGTLIPPPEWFSTGDLGTFDSFHGLKILGRKDWQFISGGENIQPEEIEQHLRNIPEILDAAVVPKQDPEFGARPVAWIETTTPLSLDFVQKKLQEHLPKFKIPIALLIVDALPKKGLKIDRKTLFERTKTF